MQTELFTAYFFGLLFTFILNIYNILLSPYLKDKLIFKNWNNIYRVWILIILSIILRFYYPVPSLLLTNVSTTLYIYFYLKLWLILKNKINKFHKILVILSVLHLAYNLYFSFVIDSLFYKAIVNNSIFIVSNILLIHRFLELPSKSKIKNIVILSFSIISMVWFSRLLLFFLIKNDSLISNNIINSISIYALTPMVTLQNISIILYVFDLYHHENINIKKKSISLQNESVFINFLNSLFHEINTPLSIAIGGITSMKKSENDATKRQIEELIENSLEKIISILNDRKLVYGVDEKLNEAYITRDLDKIIKRILAKNFTTKNVSIVTSYHSDVIKASLRSIFSILLPLLEMFQLHRINSEILVNFLSDSIIEVEIINDYIFSYEVFNRLNLPEDEDIFTTLNPELSEKLHSLSNYISMDNRSLEIIHENNNEIYRIKF